MRASRFLRTPTYLVAIILAFLALLDFLVTVWPLQFANMRWRVGAMGQLSGALTGVMISLLLTFAASVIFDHPKVQRLLVAVAGLITALLLVVITLFVLDLVQLRVSVRPEVKRAFDIVAIQAFIKLLLGLVVSTVFAVASFRASRAEVASRRRGAEGPAMVVGSRG